MRMESSGGNKRRPFILFLRVDMKLSAGLSHVGHGGLKTSF